MLSGLPEDEENDIDLFPLARIPLLSGVEYEYDDESEVEVNDFVQFDASSDSIPKPLSSNLNVGGN